MLRRILFLLLPVLLFAQSAPVEITAEPHHHLVFSNDQIRVFAVEIPPRSETLLHWHRHDYIYVQLGNSEVVNAVQGKEPATVKLHDGQTGFLSADFAHAARNLTGQPFRNLSVELLHDEQLRHSHTRWDEDRGLKILEGGTQEILFVHDGVRASEFELQAGGVVPSRPRSHPLLLVAVNDLRLSLGDPRTHGGHETMASPGRFKSGDARWLPLGFRRPIVNAGKQSARFVTLEFP